MNLPLRASAGNRGYSEKSIGETPSPFHDGVRHKGRSNYNFVDGHAAARGLRATFDPAKQLDMWDPFLAP